MPHTDQTDRDERRAAVAELGDALRRATEASIAEEGPIERLAEAAALADRITHLLSGHPRPLTRLPATDDLSMGVRYFSPVTGPGSPLAPPLTFGVDGDDVLVRARFDRRYEGPPGHVHGGVTAMVFDEILGQAANNTGRWGMTVALHTDYLRALPLDVELEFRSRVVEISGRKTRVEGTAAVAATPDVIHVNAYAVFVEPRAEAQQRYFGDLTDASGTSVPAKHGSLIAGR
jgi:acyl-coenzyme A thioesterase PaaI-like protein